MILTFGMAAAPIRTVGFSSDTMSLSSFIGLENRSILVGPWETDWSFMDLESRLILLGYNIRVGSNEEILLFHYESHDRIIQL